MNFSKQAITGKSFNLFFIRFLLLFIILYLFLPFYWGITGPGGKIYSPFLAENLNFIKGFSHFLTASANIILRVLGYDTFQYQYNALRIGYSRGVVVNPSCLGWGIMSFWVAFVYANTGSKPYKLKWISAGIVAIVILNIVRIALIALANHNKWHFILSLDYHNMFNIASYCCIFILLFLYIKIQKKYERIVSNTPSFNNKLSTV